MQYLGGKSKISKEIATLIDNILINLGGGLYEIPWRQVTHFDTALECREYDIRERERERERERGYSSLSFVGLVLLSRK